MVQQRTQACHQRPPFFLLYTYLTQRRLVCHQICFTLYTTPPGVSCQHNVNLTLLGCQVDTHFTLYLTQKSVKWSATLKSCRDLHPRHARESGVGQGRVEQVSGLQKYFSISLSLHPPTSANPLNTRLCEGLHLHLVLVRLTLQQGRAEQSLPYCPSITPLPYPTLFQDAT